MKQLLHGDCLELMKDIPDQSIDFILTDPPYGTTACKWDTVIPFETMWPQLKRIIKPNGAIALFGSEPFSSALRMSNIKQFKYDWVWKKSNKGSFVNAKLKPLTEVEIISIFSTGMTSNNSNKNMVYYPQGLVPFNKMTKGTRRKVENGYQRPCRKEKHFQEWTNYPSQLISFKNEKGFHPTQKPVPLLEYLIKTYTLEGETVLDFTMGSGSTGIAAKNLNRNFIGIEKDDKYFEIAKNRIEELSK